MEVLKPLVAELLELIKNGKDFAGSQLPDVAQQILRYERVIAYMWLAVSLAILGLGIFFLCRAIKGSDDDYLPFFVGGAVFFGGMGLLLFFCNLSELVQMQVAPKLYLLTYLRDFLKN